jgi:hypothetical protein
MTYRYARIRLAKTTYQCSVQWQYLTDINIDELNRIYHKYCQYRKFASVMPIFESQYRDSTTDIIGYYDQSELVAFSMIKRFDDRNAQAMQFAWTYHKPKLRLGITSLQTECAIYRDRGFEFLYLDQADTYKSEIQGFEILGPL